MSRWGGGSRFTPGASGGATPALSSVLTAGNTATGPILLGDGSAAAPSFAFSGRTGTGAYAGGTGGDSFEIATNGAAHTTFWNDGSNRRINANGSLQLQGAGNIGLTVDNSGNVYLGSSTVLIGRGAGDPEGAVAAPVGSLFLRTDGSTGTTLYVKESGSGNTGWVAK